MWLGGWAGGGGGEKPEVCCAFLQRCGGEAGGQADGRAGGVERGRKELLAGRARHEAARGSPGERRRVRGAAERGALLQAGPGHPGPGRATPTGLCRSPAAPLPVPCFGGSTERWEKLAESLASA